MFDNRCPACNHPVVGTEEVLEEVPTQVPAHCPTCATKIQSVFAYDEDLVAAYIDFA